jgi:hypothetical protein
MQLPESGQAGALSDCKTAEVTPEMVEAGAATYWNFNPEYALTSEIVVRIYEAMERARISQTS